MRAGWRCFVLALVPIQLAAAQQDRPIFRASVESVLVDVSVRRGRGAVTSLLAGDFVVRDNGVVQDVELLSSDQLMPLDVSLLIDVSETSKRAVFDSAKQVVLRLPALLGPDDRLETLTFGSTVRRHAGGHIRMPSAFELRHTALWDALAMALMQQPEPARRRLVVVLTDGVDTASVVNIEFVTGIADASDAMLHVVAIPDGWSTMQLGGAPFRSYSWLLRAAVERTGGELHQMRAGSDLLEPIKQALGRLREHYVLRYTPAGVSASGWHEIDVDVTGDGDFEVRARKGYFR